MKNNSRKIDKIFIKSLRKNKIGTVWGKNEKAKPHNKLVKCHDRAKLLLN